jgi:hypothetical protein
MVHCNNRIGFGVGKGVLFRRFLGCQVPHVDEVALKEGAVPQWTVSGETRQVPPDNLPIFFH